MENSARREAATLPPIIQGGMGIGISNWVLARAVAAGGQLGVVSGTALDAVLVRRLQNGDPGGHMRRALAAFPNREIARKISDKYYVPGGVAPDAPYKLSPQFTLAPVRELLGLVVAANFAEVYLAKEGHTGPVGVNYLEKIQLPFLPSLYGALLAGVDCVLVGAGIPREVPLLLDELCGHRDVSMKVSVEGAGAEDDYRVSFSPSELMGAQAAPLKRPVFLAIVSSASLAQALVRRSPVPPDGFVIEGTAAGGHNAPPRGAMKLNERGEPIYGPRDEADLEAVGALGLPFWLAGSYGSPGALGRAHALGARGIQVGTAFAFCRESGFPQAIKAGVIENAVAGRARVRTDAAASPTDFPFKLFELEGTLGRRPVYEKRPRVPCDVALLRRPYKRADGTVGYRCSAEPVSLYTGKGGAHGETEGRMCLCNALLAAADLPQRRAEGYHEPAAVTCGSDTACIASLAEGRGSYGAADVIAALLAEEESAGNSPQTS